MMSLLRALTIVLFTVFAALPADAQVVRGRVLDDMAGGAVAGGFVRLVRSDGGIAASTLTNPTGAYQLSASAGVYRLRVERIGVRTYESPEFTLDSVLVRDLRIPLDAIALPAIEGSGDRRCNDSGVKATAAVAVWEEVQKSLSVASWTATHGNVLYQLKSVSQQFDPRMRLVGEQTETTLGTVGGSPYAALDLDSLIAHGFVQLRPDGTYSYYGPDAELILSEAFQETHCFQAVVDRKKPTMVGLSFKPNGTIDGSDIEGTLWIDRESYELRKLEFLYTKLPVNAPRSMAGGDITFTRLDTGMWILNEWTIRAPITTTRRSGPLVLDCTTCAPRKVQPMFVGYQQATHSVVTARVDGQVIYTAPDIDQ